VDLNRVAPAVVVGERAAGGFVDVVRSDDEAGVRLALDHLSALGHRRIAHVASRHGESMKARTEAYRAWMAERAAADAAAGQPPVATAGRAARGAAAQATSAAARAAEVAADVIWAEETEEGGLAAAREFTARAELPTAVLASMDRCAVGLLRGFAAAGVHVPGEVSVVGFDDQDMAQFGGPALTTVRQDAAALAGLAMDYLTDRIDGFDAPPRVSVLAPSLRIRSTTGPARPPG
jgi:DNA-binding LacI/PurR family transcriptional regulator